MDGAADRDGQLSLEAVPPLSARGTITALLAIAFGTSSFDRVLTFDLGGANFRLAQIAIVLLLLLAFGKIIQTGIILWPRGGIPLLIWSMLQCLLVTRGPAPLLSFEFFGILLLEIISVFAVLQLVGRARWLESLIKIYLQSFVFIALCGLAQFVAPSLFRVKTPVIVQWILYGYIPRISGFSYEPSYFATYLVMGWIALIDLRCSGAAIVAGRRWYRAIWIVSLAMLFSTSKTAWLIMMLEGALRLLPFAADLLQKQKKRLFAGDLRWPLPRVRIVLWTATAVLAFFTLLGALATVVDPNILLAGTGINHSAAHSVNQRIEDYAVTTQALAEHPWLGISLGGVAARITELRGQPVDIANMKINFGFPVPVEVLAAGGILGTLPLLWFFLVITVGERRLMQDNWQDERARWLHAFIRALAFEWLCLCADQNLARIYLWFHVTIVVLVGYNLRHLRTPNEHEKRLSA